MPMADQRPFPEIQDQKLDHLVERSPRVGFRLKEIAAVEISERLDENLKRWWTFVC